MSKLIALRAEIELMRIKKEDAERACAFFYEIKATTENPEKETNAEAYLKETPMVTPDLKATSN